MIYYDIQRFSLQLLIEIMILQIITTLNIQKYGEYISAKITKTPKVSISL